MAVEELQWSMGKVRLCGPFPEPLLQADNVSNYTTWSYLNLLLNKVNVLVVLITLILSGYDSRGGSGRRAFGSGYRRDDDYRGGGGGGGGGDRYGDRYDDRRDDRKDDKSDRWNGYSRNDDRREERGMCIKHLNIVADSN